MSAELSRLSPFILVPSRSYVIVSYEKTCNPMESTSAGQRALDGWEDEHTSGRSKY